MKLKIDWKAALRALGKFLLRIGKEELKRRIDEIDEREKHGTGPGAGLVLLAALLLGACTHVEIPDIPWPPSRPSPAPSPSAPPTPTPPASPSPTPSPSPSPEPDCTVTGCPDGLECRFSAHSSTRGDVYTCAGPTVPPSPSPKPPKKVCDPKYAAANQCLCCDGEIAFEQSRGRLVCPDGWPGSDINPVNLDGELVERRKYDPVYGHGMCHSTSDRSRYLVSRQCIKHTIDGNPVGPAFEKLCPWPPPEPKPSPSPSPTVPSPSPSPNPDPDVPSTPPSNDATLARVGIKLHDIQDKGKPGPKTQGGKRYIFNVTPKSVRPWCEHTTERNLWLAYKAGDKGAFGRELTPAEEAVYRAKEAAGTLADGVAAQRLECEQHVSRQDPRGAKGYQTLPGRFTNHELEQSGVNPYLMQIRITDPAENGIYTIRVCPYDDPITSPRCSEWVGEVSTERTRP